MKKAIINADDFGFDESCTQAIYEGLKAGLFTDTTMVANGGALSLVKKLVENDPLLKNKIGIHFNLTAGAPLSEKMMNNSKFVTDGTFNKYFLRHSMYYVHLSSIDKESIYEELCVQVEKVNSIVPITHADSHQHTHMAFYLLPIYMKVCKKYGIRKVRIKKNVEKPLYKTLVSNFYRTILRKNGFITTDYFSNIKEYKNGQLGGVSEMMIHPDYDSNGILIDRIKVTVDDKGNIQKEGISITEVLDKYLDKDISLISYYGL